MPPIKILLFLAATAVMAYVSRASLGAPRSHGFSRFFAWEALLALVLLNPETWFRRPFAWFQVVSWLLLFSSLVPLTWGTLLLKRLGKPDARRSDDRLFGLEKTTELVTSGIYGLIRHPMYGSLLLVAWGVFFKKPGWLGGLLALAATVFLTLTARIEEGENLRYFGPAYRDYMSRTKMFLPYVF